MARSHLTLAALATAALPELELASSASMSSSSGDYDLALIADREGQHWMVRLPRNQRAEAKQNAELVALSALTVGARELLPFDLPNVVGQVPYGPTRAMVYRYVYGRPFKTKDLQPGRQLLVEIGTTIAAIHSLPLNVVSQSGLVLLSADDCRKQTLALIERAVATGKVPARIEERWLRVAGEAELWQFQPTVIHGNLNVDALLAIGDEVTGVLDWSGLKAADPAQDLSWIMSSVHPESAAIILDAYTSVRQINLDEVLRKRTTLYSELELARWLLHGVHSGNQEIQEDAVTMLHNLLDRVTQDLNSPLADHEHQPLSENQVTQLLAENDFGTIDLLDQPESGSRPAE